MNGMGLHGFKLRATCVLDSVLGYHACAQELASSVPRRMVDEQERLGRRKRHPLFIRVPLGLAGFFAFTAVRFRPLEVNMPAIGF